MSYSPEAAGLRKVATVALPRIQDRLSFLALDRCKIVQGRTGVIAILEDGSEVQVPGGSLTVLMLGPGVSITTPALRTFANSGCVVMASTALADGWYTTAVPLTSSGKWACAQARVWADPGARVEAARFLYGQRFDDDLPDDITIAQLRGLEGKRMKAAYKQAAASIGLSHWRRKVDDADGTANSCLNLANSILYGVAASVCSALCLSPALGIIHQGAANAFLFDLADCFKTEVSIPVAFQSSKMKDPASETRRGVRSAMKRQRVLARMTTLTIKMLEPHLPVSAGNDVLYDQQQVVPGHRNYSDKSRSAGQGAELDGEPF